MYGLARAPDILTTDPNPLGSRTLHHLLQSCPRCNAHRGLELGALGGSAQQLAQTDQDQAGGNRRCNTGDQSGPD